MIVRELKYQNFRNLSSGLFTPCEGINVIYGNNAQGKTNLIEAIWLFSGQKSFRTSKDAELIKLGEEKTTLDLKFFSASREQTAVLEIQNKRVAKLNEIEQKKTSNLGSAFSAVLFSPNDMDLIKDGPSVRRKFLDDVICVLRPKYEKVLKAYNKAIIQRNAVLKDSIFHSSLEGLLDAYEDRIAKFGSYLISQRKKYIEALDQYAPVIYKGISLDEEFTIEYKSSSGEGEYEDLRKSLLESRVEDTKNCTTSTGPHRDDIDFLINGLSVKSFGSQGQKRSVVLSLKLAEAEILKKFTNEEPIAILDDVMSELDRKRQDYILNHIKGWQVFITCCDPKQIESLKAGSLFKMENGQLVKEI